MVFEIVPVSDGVQSLRCRGEPRLLSGSRVQSVRERRIRWPHGRTPDMVAVVVHREAAVVAVAVVVLFALAAIDM